MKPMPILMKGEKLAETITKSNSGGEKKYPYEYEEAKMRLLHDISLINNELDNNSQHYLSNEIILSIRMNEDFLAKSYMPDFLEKKESMEFVGARIYNKRVVKSKEKKSKLYFVKTSRDNIEWLEKDLNSDHFTQSERKQLRSIESIDFLATNEKLLGFNEPEQTDKVEIVLHPLREQLDFAVELITNHLNKDYEVRYYKNGPTFILGSIRDNEISNLCVYNFLRTIHPIREINLPNLNSVSSKVSLPYLPKKSANKPKIKIGVFDGGLNTENVYIKEFSNYYDLSSIEPIDDYLTHGTAVSGVILYGELNKYKSTDILPEPDFQVENFRVLPEKNMYIIIDNIEKIVDERNDINIYNISFGPRGPILDDQIDRFTYALDLLSLKGKVFTIAVGNDGNAAEPFNRIQVPSDSVNNISVGAYSIYENHIYRASYSCIGLGREGAKIKPDLLAFGGDERNLFHLIDLKGQQRLMLAGTSFAAPLVARRLGELLKSSSQLTPLISRTLLLHTATSIIKDGKQSGFGVMANSIEDVLNCNKQKVTVLFNGFIFPSRSIKLPIPFPDKEVKGRIHFSWTICTLTNVDTKDSDLYTNSCIEETFYPHSNIYSFSKKNEKKTFSVNIITDINQANQLKSLGYKASLNPKSDTPNYKSEIQRRLEYKWDTISQKEKGKESQGVFEPFLIISGLNRNKSDLNKIEYCIAVTVECKKYSGNMYDDIMTKYKILTPLDVTAEIKETVETK